MAGGAETKSAGGGSGLGPGPPRSTAERLRKAKNEVLEQWMKRVCVEIGGAAQQERLVLANELPQYIDSLVDALSQREARAAMAASCREHGEQRAKIEEYGVEQIITEYEILQETLFAILEPGGTISPAERDIIRQFIIMGIKSAAVAFSSRQTSLIQEQKYCLEAVLKSMGEGLIAVDTKGDLLFSNPTAERVTGVPMRTWGRPNTWPAAFGLYHADKVTPLLVDELPIVKALKGESSDDVEVFIRNERFPDGHWQCVNARPIFNKEGKITGAVKVMGDITRRKRMDGELKAAMAELSRSNEELERFASLASHDLREPLRTISSYLRLLQKRYGGQLGKDAEEFIGFAVDGAQRMTTLLNALLSYAKITRERQPFKPIKTSELVAKILANLKLMIDDSGAKISVSALPDVIGDPGMLWHVFQNLVHNALKFRSGKPLKVEIGAEDKGKEWLFHVKDNGIGIEPDGLSRVFDPFVRGNGPEGQSGYGIGLAICRKVLDLHHGRIWAESAPAEGSTFYFTLPKAPQGR